MLQSKWIPKQSIREDHAVPRRNPGENKSFFLSFQQEHLSTVNRLVSCVKK